jgi:hypothetical protein
LTMLFLACLRRRMYFQQNRNGVRLRRKIITNFPFIYLFYTHKINTGRYSLSPSLAGQAISSFGPLRSAFANLNIYVFDFFKQIPKNRSGAKSAFSIQRETSLHYPLFSTYSQVCITIV